MRLISGVLASLLIIGASGTGAIADEVAIPGTTVSFIPPEGFTPLTPNEIKNKYPSGRAPQFVLGNERRGTTVAYDLKPHAISPDQLEEVKDRLEKTFPRAIPGLVWKERKIIDLNGRPWVLLEMTSTTIETDIYNIILATSYDNKLLLFNFNSTKEDFPRMERVLRKSISTLSIK